MGELIGVNTDLSTALAIDTCPYCCGSEGVELQNRGQLSQDLGRFLGIVDVKAAYRDVGTISRKILSSGVSLTHPSQRQIV